jgi:hypothetical protein
MRNPACSMAGSMRLAARFDFAQREARHNLFAVSTPPVRISTYLQI